MPWFLQVCFWSYGWPAVSVSWRSLLFSTSWLGLRYGTGRVGSSRVGFRSVDFFSSVAHSSRFSLVSRSLLPQHNGVLRGTRATQYEGRGENTKSNLTNEKPREEKKERMEISGCAPPPFSCPPGSSSWGRRETFLRSLQAGSRQQNPGPRGINGKWVLGGGGSDRIYIISTTTHTHTPPPPQAP